MREHIRSYKYKLTQVNLAFSKCLEFDCSVIGDYKRGRIDGAIEALSDEVLQLQEMLEEASLEAEE